MQYGDFLNLLAVLGFVAFVTVVVIIYWVRHDLLVRSRRGLPDSVYEQAFASDPRTLEVALVVRTEVRSRFNVPEFGVLPGDNLYGLVALDEEDVWEICIVLFRRFGRTYEELYPDEVDELNGVETVGELVGFLARATERRDRHTA